MNTKIPSPKNFDYYLWKDSESGKYFAKIKCTGEVCELTHEEIKFLRNEEKRIIRAMPTSDKKQYEAELLACINGYEMKRAKIKQEKKSKRSTQTILSLDLIMKSEEFESDWLKDSTDYAELVETKIMEEEFRKLLTAKQLDVYEKCMLGNLSFKNYALLHKTSKQNIFLCAEGIRKKSKIFFGVY